MSIEASFPSAVLNVVTADAAVRAAIAQVPPLSKVTGNPAVLVSNSTAETNLIDVVIPGGTLGPQSVLQARLFNALLNNTGAAMTYRLRFYFGGILVLDSGAISINNNAANLSNFDVDYVVANLGATNAQAAWAKFFTSGQIADGSMTTAGAWVQGGKYAPIAVDTTVAQHLTVTATLGTASANGQWKMWAGVVTLQT